MSRWVVLSRSGREAISKEQGGKPRVLHIGPLPPPWGGVATNLSYLLDSDRLSTFDMAVVNTAQQRPREDVNPVKRIWHLRRLAQALRTFWDLWRAIKRYRPDIVHIQSAGLDASVIRDMLLIPIASWGRCRVVFHQHFWADPKRFDSSGKAVAFFYRRLMPRAAAVLMSSPLHIEQAARLINVDRAHYFPNTCVPPTALRRERRRPGDGVCQVVYVGRLSRLKGTYDLIAAIARLVRSSRDFRFVLIGVGATAADDERVNGLVAEHQLGEHVVLKGPVAAQEKWRILSESQIMVLPSLGELFPVTLVEGLAAGLPIVTTSVDYLPRLIVHGENGFIVPPSAPIELAEALRVLGADAETRERMGSANRLKFENEFALDVVAGKLRRIYESVLDGAPTAKV